MASSVNKNPRTACIEVASRPRQCESPQPATNTSLLAWRHCQLGCHSSTRLPSGSVTQPNDRHLHVLSLLGHVRALEAQLREHRIQVADTSGRAPAGGGLLRVDPRCPVAPVFTARAAWLGAGWWSNKSRRVRTDDEPGRSVDIRLANCRTSSLGCACAGPPPDCCTSTTPPPHASGTARGSFALRPHADARGPRRCNCKLLLAVERGWRDKKCTPGLRQTAVSTSAARNTLPQVKCHDAHVGRPILQRLVAHARRPAQVAAMREGASRNSRRRVIAAADASFSLTNRCICRAAEVAI
jgi:hypothetical protein